jgi:hypothetical protein
MKKLIIFFLSLTCLSANAQYKSRSITANPKPTLLSQYESGKLSTNVPGKTDLNLPALPANYTTTTNQVNYVSINSPTPTAPSQAVQGYWTGSRILSSGMNGRFQAVQSFDLQGNFRESKATFQFTNRKKQ